MDSKLIQVGLMSVWVKFGSIAEYKDETTRTKLIWVRFAGER